jgi:hypothetical protein
MKSAKISTQQKQFWWCLLLVFCEFIFLASISGVPLRANLLITFGLFVQIGLGLGITTVFISSLSISIAGRIFISMVLGIIPICIIAFLFDYSKFLSSLITGLIAILGFLNLSRLLHPRPSEIKFAELTTIQLDRLVIALIVTNLVFARFHQTPLGLVGLLCSILIIFLTPNHYIHGLKLYLIVIVLIVVVNSVATVDTSLYELFRTSHDMFFERVWGLSIISTNSLQNPFFAGSNIHYHFLSYVYFTSFEEIFNVSENHFSPTFLAVCLFALIILLLENVEPFKSRNKAALFALLILGSWPFWSSFPLDDISRSQSLSLAFAALCLVLLPRISTFSSSLLFGILVGWTFLTKTTSGLFLLLVSFTFLLMSWRKSLKDSGRRKHLIDHLYGNRHLFVATVLGICATGVSYLIVFSTLNGPTPEYANTSIGFVFPKVYWGIGLWNLNSSTKALIFFLALSPSVVLLCILLRNYYSSTRQRVTTHITNLSFSVLVGSIFLAGFGLVFVGEYNLNHYFVSTAAIFGGAAAFSFVELPVIRWSLPTLLLLASVVLTAFLFLKMKQEAEQGLVDVKRILLITFTAVLVIFVFRFLQKVDWISCLFWAIVLLCFGNSVGSSWSAVRWTGYDLTRSNEIGNQIISLKNLSIYFESIESSIIIAIDPEVRSSNIATLLAASTPLQYWAGRYDLEDTNEFRWRVVFQEELALFPSNQILMQAEDEAITHVLLLSEASKLGWAHFLDSQNPKIEMGDRPVKVFEDNRYTVYRLPP